MLVSDVLHGGASWRRGRHQLRNVRHDDAATRAALLQQSALPAVVVVQSGHRELVSHAGPWLPLEVHVSGRAGVTASDTKLRDYRLSVHVLVRDGGRRGTDGRRFERATLARWRYVRARAAEARSHFLPQFVDLVVRRRPTQTEAVYPADHLRRRVRSLLRSEHLDCAVIRVGTGRPVRCLADTGRRRLAVFRTAS